MGLRHFKCDNVERKDIWLKCKVRSINISLKARLESCNSVRETVSSSTSGSSENRCPRKANRLEITRSQLVYTNHDVIKINSGAMKVKGHNEVSTYKSLAMQSGFQVHKFIIFCVKLK